MSSVFSTTLPSDLSKLNVSQLKAICKERRIVGYSKLGKAALIRKLADLVQCAPPSTLTQKTSSETATQVAVGMPAYPVVRIRTARSSVPSDPHIFPGAAATQTTIVNLTSKQLSDTAQIASMEKNCAPPAFTAKGNTSKRLPSESETSQGQITATPLAKKQKVVGFSSATFSSSAAGGSTSISSSAPTSQLLSLAVPVPPYGLSLLPGLAGAQRLVRTQPMGTTTASGKRFKPLEIMRPPTAMSGDIENTQMALGLHGDGARTKVPHTAIRHWYLDFPPMARSALSSITLPPSLTERRLVQRWAIILSGLSKEERFRCCFVSKLIRYAVYSSAYYLLCKDFSGQRLSLVLQQYGLSSLMMNFWPYLRQREQEVLERKNAVMSSFLFPAFRGHGVLISARLWASPDNEKQLTVALRFGFSPLSRTSCQRDPRFLLTRLWFGLSCAKSVQTNWLYDVVTDVEETVKGEIWYVTTRNSRSGHLQAFHVLEATCEVLGFVEGARSDDFLRADWAAYVQRRKENPDNGLPFHEAMRWADHAEYERGISRHWLRRTAQMGAQGSALRTIAERYTLACVGQLERKLDVRSANGTRVRGTGPARDAAGACQDGFTPQPILACASVLHVMSCLTSELAFRHHHVESVHLTATGGSLLHLALAVVQTPAREYYILRDNGMEVGCEEDGVARVWMRILGCNSRGEPVEQAGVSFEELMAYIQDL
ncbi:hypothetical protein EDB87DRAFT_1683726 [Lactarius vividus]|nr:hypothetical protein EDB87DRAFT_1683726 [Lactarius vividus]